MGLSWEKQVGGRVKAEEERTGAACLYMTFGEDDR